MVFMHDFFGFVKKQIASLPVASAASLSLDFQTLSLLLKYEWNKHKKRPHEYQIGKQEKDTFPHSLSLVFIQEMSVVRSTKFQRTGIH